MRTLRSRPARCLMAVTALALVASACSGDDTTAGKRDKGGNGDGDSAETTGSTAPPEQYTGSVDDFYKVPDPLPKGAPGQLIRIQKVKDDAGAVTLRVMYHSRDGSRKDRAVTGIITYPKAPAPAGGWPVVSWSHGTTGIAPKCAPSRLDSPAFTFGIQGVAVATDYVGLGPVGEVHPYLSKFSEGNAAIDAVRAARNLPEAHASDRWFSLGHSQGGHGALSAAELSPTYAPELKLLGTVAFAPGSDLTRRFNAGIDAAVAQVTGAMAFVGSASEYPQMKLEDYAGPKLLALRKLIETECLDQIQIPIAGIPPAEVYAHDPQKTEPARSLLLANEVGTVKVDAPLLLVAGTADIRVVIERVRSLYGRLCKIGQITELLVIDGATHDDIVPRTSQQTTAFLQARLKGDPPKDTCSS